MPDLSTPDILVVGGAHMDRIGRSIARLEPGQSNPGTLRRSIGGVAGNIARVLARLDWQVALSSILGDDSVASLIREQLQTEGIDTRLILSEQGHASASYTAIEDRNGALIAAIADMAIYDRYPDSQIDACLASLAKPTHILADTNLPPEGLAHLAANKGQHKLAVCAVSGPKASRAASCLATLDLLFCNEAEAAILADEYANLATLPEILMESGVKAGVITKGNAGLTAWQDGKLYHLPAPPVKVRSSNGAGDCLTACILHGLMLDVPFKEALRTGLAGASFALMSEQSVPDMLSRAMLDASLSDIPQS